MVDTEAKPHYLAVNCRSCAVPIPVPDAAVTRAKGRRKAQAPDSGDDRTPRLNLRCSACEREYLYTVDEVQECEGTPWTRRIRSGAASKLLRTDPKLARAAGA